MHTEIVPSIASLKIESLLLKGQIKKNKVCIDCVLECMSNIRCIVKLYSCYILEDKYQTSHTNSTIMYGNESFMQRRAGHGRP